MDAGRERDLIDRCRRGDQDAFQDLVEAYKGLVFAMIARTIPDRSRAEDAAQDVFLRIYRGLPYFRGESRLSTWIYRIVANVCAQEQSHRPPPASLDDDREGRRPAPPPVADSRF